MLGNPEDGMVNFEDGWLIKFIAMKEIKLITRKKSTTRGKNKQALLFLDHGVCQVVAKEPPSTDCLCGGAKK